MASVSAKVSKKDLAATHAAVDELAAKLPEGFAHLSGLLANLLSSTASVSVPVRGRKAAAVEVEDEEDDVPVVKRGRGKTKAVADDFEDEDDQEEEEEEEEEAEEEEEESEAETVDLDNIDADSILEAFDGIEEVPESHERVAGALREMTAEVNGFYLNAAEIAKAEGAAKPADKKAVMENTLIKINMVIDGIMEFDLVDIVSFATDAAAEADLKFTPKKAGKEDAKKLHAATELFRATIKAAAEAE